MTSPIDPEHSGWLVSIIAYLTGILTMLAKNLFKRTETDVEKHGKMTYEHIKESDLRYARIETRLSVLESVEYVTLPDLKLAISEAIAEAQKLFTPQHQELAVEFRSVVKESKKETEELVRECNGAIRRDFGDALIESTTAVKKAYEAMDHSAKLMGKIMAMIEQSGFERRRKK